MYLLAKINGNAIEAKYIYIIRIYIDSMDFVNISANGTII